MIYIHMHAIGILEAPFNLHITVLSTIMMAKSKCAFEGGIFGFAGYTAKAFSSYVRGYDFYITLNVSSHSTVDISYF